MEAQCAIWVYKGQPLKESEWLKQGYTSLLDYVQKLIIGHDGHRKTGCHICAKHENLPLVTFGLLGEERKDIILICKIAEELPTEDVIAAVGDEDITLISFNA